MISRPLAYVLAIAFLSASCGIAHAQHVGHEAHVHVPDIGGIRIVGAGSGHRSVTFDYADDGTEYLRAVERGVVEPTHVHRFEDVQVRVNRQGRWSIHVVATAFASTATGPSPSIAIERVEVHRGVSSGLVQDAIVGSGASAGILDAWNLSTESQRIAFRTGSTGGWRSLGFSGRDYRLVLDGTEAPGDHVAMVTYTLTFP